ncbi:MAG: immunity 50 family protein [Candidatus Thiodiazotropha endolucinida]|uniref:Immunity 50 family protein n=1 Tax=Candidatus Thiodiazotropha taylori TaxID=2792791 RepID=A0A9E4NM84_9GAMM|nr:immunity 50 family protein [Candidatus Thiodiazotropha taylori]MCW4237908.1 immunity 50 family protein [Candidatus Thiodiazotropha endolucinida]
MNIVQAEIVEDEYGEWPSFHDAEIIKITLKRGEKPGKYANLAADINLYYTKSINVGTSLYETIKLKDNVISFEFYGVDNLNLEGFNHQNVIDELHVKEGKNGYSVEFESIFGVQASFQCEDIAVLGMVSKDEYRA